MTKRNLTLLEVLCGGQFTYILHMWCNLYSSLYASVTTHTRLQNC